MHLDRIVLNFRKCLEVLTKSDILLSLKGQFHRHHFVHCIAKASVSHICCQNLSPSLVIAIYNQSTFAFQIPKINIPDLNSNIV